LKKCRHEHDKVDDDKCELPGGGGDEGDGLRFKGGHAAAAAAGGMQHASMHGHRRHSKTYAQVHQVQQAQQQVQQQQQSQAEVQQAAAGALTLQQVAQQQQAQQVQQATPGHPVISVGGGQNVATGAGTLMRFKETDSVSLEAHIGCFDPTSRRTVVQGD
jgi:hypothetical protein